MDPIKVREIIESGDLAQIESLGKELVKSGRDDLYRLYNLKQDDPSESIRNGIERYYIETYGGEYSNTVRLYWLKDTTFSLKEHVQSLFETSEGEILYKLEGYDNGSYGWAVDEDEDFEMSVRQKKLLLSIDRQKYKTGEKKGTVKKEIVISESSKYENKK